MNQQYQLQVEKLRELEAYLHRVSLDVQNIMRSYADKVSGMAGEGLPMEVHDKIMREFYMTSQNHATGISQTNEQAIGYVRYHIQQLEPLMGR